MAGRSTETPFSPEEAAKLREQVRSGQRPLLCPRCGAPLAAGAPAAGGGTVPIYWFYRCEACRRGLMIGDLKSS